jgi:hypothetical protein
MAFGQLRCVGNSVHLKNKFGDGYHINIITYPKRSDQVLAFVKKALPEATLLASNADSLTFTLPFAHMKKVPKFFKTLESTERSLVKDWSISHTCLYIILVRSYKFVSVGRCVSYCDESC